MKIHSALLCLFLAQIPLATSCGANGTGPTHGRSAPAAGAAEVAGSVVDAATGDPVAGARIDGPRGRTARSDARGRFLLADLGVGTEGEIRATASDGRAASVRLRALQAGRLEVVLQLTRR